MSDGRTLEELKAAGGGRLAPPELVSLYHEAFAAFGTQALWSRAPSATPTIAQALVVAESLRCEGGMNLLPLAARIEAACRAAL